MSISNNSTIWKPEPLKFREIVSNGNNNTSFTLPNSGLLEDYKKGISDEIQYQRNQEFKDYINQSFALQEEALRQAREQNDSVLGLAQRMSDQYGIQVQDFMKAMAPLFKQVGGNTSQEATQQSPVIGSSQSPAYTVVTSPKEASYNFMHLRGSNGIGYRRYNSPIEGARAMMHQLDLYFSGRSNAAKGYDMIKNGRSLGSPSYTPWGQQMVPNSYKPFANGVNPNTINHMIASGLLAPNNDNNNPEEYASVVSKRSGIGRDDVLDVRNREQMRRLLPAIAHIEGNPHASLLTPELVDSLYDRNSLTNQMTKDLSNTAYYYGGRNPYSGKGIDCSGWTGYVLEQLGMPEYKQYNAADQIKLAEQKGRPVSVEELMNGVNMDGVLIGLAGGSNGKGKYKGIGHIVYTFKDPNTQQIMVTESSSGKGVHVSYLSEWLDNYVVKKKRNVYGVKLN